MGMRKPWKSYKEEGNQQETWKATDLKTLKSWIMNLKTRSARKQDDGSLGAQTTGAAGHVLVRQGGGTEGQRPLGGNDRPQAW